MRKTIFWISLLIVVLAAMLLITGSEILVLQISKSLEMPFGTVSTWVGLMALPLIFLSSSEKLWLRVGFRKWYAYLLWFIVGFSSLWGIISYALSGKWNFTFSGSSPTFIGSDEASEVFWLLTKITAALPIILFAIYTLQNWLANKE